MDVSPLGSLPFKLSNPFPLLWEKEYILPIHTNPFKKVTRRIVRRYWVMMIVYIHILYIYIYGTQTTHILKDLTHKMEGQPPKKRSVGF